MIKKEKWKAVGGVCYPHSTTLLRKDDSFLFLWHDGGRGNSGKQQ
ncbi:hypothetical protein HMPREF0620_0912 [Parascardovia denticolens DSM 10105 = JCM 12538]|uniref:Uncharacterized protein n=1 Tax=Parascardovia denticolens DSM 10105 = JCM 12538 TaxID=864564 RepID=E6JYX2_PARDN|nr:hypothetical protein HMPREF0620_0912 [Parascardovia denticolens DSM 10105 = JCM 12538]